MKEERERKRKKERIGHCSADLPTTGLLPSSEMKEEGGKDLNRSSMIASLLVTVRPRCRVTIERERVRE